MRRAAAVGNSRNPSKQLFASNPANSFEGRQYLPYRLACRTQSLARVKDSDLPGRQSGRQDRRRCVLRETFQPLERSRPAGRLYMCIHDGDLRATVFSNERVPRQVIVHLATPKTLPVVVDTGWGSDGLAVQKAASRL
jgi:hypothetical protein